MAAMGALVIFDDWPQDKLVNAGGRKTILMTHHQLFTRNSSINHDLSMFDQRSDATGKKAVNEYLLEEFGEFLPQLSSGSGGTSTTK
jgi:hypothetical protein